MFGAAASRAQANVYDLGMTNLAAGKFTAAISNFDQALAADPADWRSHLGRGQARLQLNDCPGALADFNQVIAAPLAARETNRLTFAYFQRAQCQIRLNHPAEAVADYGQAIALAPAIAPTYYYRGMAELGLQQPGPALADFNQAIKLDPHAWQNYFERGLIRFQQKDCPDALADFTRVINAQPGGSDAHYLEQAYDWRGECEIQFKQWLEAVNDFDRAISLEPNIAWTYFDRGRAEAGIGNLVGAIGNYTRAIELHNDPHAAEFYFQRGNLEMGLNKFALAAADYRAALKLNPGYDDAQANLSEAERGIAEQATNGLNHINIHLEPQ